jgi:LysM repeat protein
VVHRVAKGETLGSIAHTYQVSISELKRNNGKLAENLRAGSTLVIKRGE